MGTFSISAKPSHTATQRMAVNMAESMASLAVFVVVSPRIMAMAKRNRADAG